MGRILCAWSPSWAIDNWRRRNPSAASPEAGEEPAPLALLETVRGVRRLAAVSREAHGLGLFAGQKATDAKALAPELATAEAEPEADAAAMTALVDWCVRFSPAVAADPPDGLFLDIAGVAHLWGGEFELMADFQRRAAGNGLLFRCAVADTPGAAWALTRYGEDRSLAPPGEQRAWLAGLPPAALRLEPEAAAQIERLGLRRLSQLMEIARGPFARRFGRATMSRLDQALGREAEALAFRRPPTPWFARLAFAEPISAPEDMARVCADVTAKLCARLEAQGQGARRFEIAYHRVDGKALPVAVGLALPGRDSRRIAKLFAPKLETVDPGFGIEVVTIAAFEVEPVSGRQGRIDAARLQAKWEPVRRTEGALSKNDAAAVEEGLAPLVDRLVNRLGEDRVWRARPAESHVPELAAVHARPFAPPDAARPWGRQTPRPARLFRRPELVEDVIALTPDDPPTRFRWRGQVFRVRRAEGPERIGEEWWKGDIDDVSTEHVRDYYRLEDEDGRRFWLFRAGLYGEAPPKWWMHGLFG